MSRGLSYRVAVALILAATAPLDAEIVRADEPALPSAQLNVLDFGARGDGVADESGAITAAVEKANLLSAEGRSPVIRFPAGIYRLTSAPPKLVGNVGLRGDGPYRSYIKVDPALSGDVFRWSEAWMGPMNGTEATIAIETQHYGASVEGLSLVGDRRAPHEQNAFVFYDRNDHVLFRDVTVYYLNGHCLQIGVPSAKPRAYMRESQFFNLECRNTGNSTDAAVEITSAGDGDATNSLYFYDTRIIFPGGIGLKIGNAATKSSTRSIYFSGLMVHGLERPLTPIAGDLILIASDAQARSVNNITFEGFSGSASYDGFYTLRLGSERTTNIPFNITLSGTITSGANGIAVDAGRSLRLSLSDIAVRGIAVKIGPRGFTGPYIRLDLNGRERTVAFEIDPSASRNLVRVPEEGSAAFDLSAPDWAIP